MTHWIEPASLFALAADSQVRGPDPIEGVLMRTELLPVSEAPMAPLDLATYAVQLDRRFEGEGPRLTGVEHFLTTLRALNEPARAVKVTGEMATHVYLSDHEIP